MKCPIRTFTYDNAYGIKQHDDLDCLKEECAWWDKDIDECRVFTSSEALVGIVEMLRQIRDKMPKDLAPRG